MVRVLVALLFAVFAFAPAQAGEKSPLLARLNIAIEKKVDAPAAPQSTMSDACANPQVADRGGPADEVNVLCCCRVMGGGSCCAQTGFCSGGFVPGCFCQP